MKLLTGLLLLLASLTIFAQSTTQVVTIDGKQGVILGERHDGKLLLNTYECSAANPKNNICQTKQRAYRPTDVVYKYPYDIKVAYEGSIYKVAAYFQAAKKYGLWTSECSYVFLEKNPVCFPKVITVNAGELEFEVATERMIFEYQNIGEAGDHGGVGDFHFEGGGVGDSK